MMNVENKESAIWMKAASVVSARSSASLSKDLSRRVESKEHQPAKQDGRPGDDGCAEFLRVEEVNVGTLPDDHRHEMGQKRGCMYVPRCACTPHLVPAAGEYCRVSRGW